MSSSEEEEEEEEDSPTRSKKLAKPFPSYSKNTYRARSKIPAIVIREHYNHPAKPPPPIVFPAPIAAPPLTTMIALNPLAPQFVPLDREYAKKGHPLLNDLLMERDIPEDRMEDAPDHLEEFREARMGFVKLASDRLNAVIGRRNERPFDLEKESDLAKQKGRLGDPFVEYAQLSTSSQRNAEQDAKALEIMSSFKTPTDPSDEDETTEDEDNNDEEKIADEPSSKKIKSNSGASIPSAKNRIEALVRHNFVARFAAEQKDEMNASPQKLSPLGSKVNKITGVGLREYFLQQHEEGLVKKRELDSITFCDFKPDTLTGEYKSKLLGHWVASRERGSKIEIYEVNLKNMRIAGESKFGIEAWVWILISRPVVTLSSDKPLKSLPPTFPRPTPTAWLAFACPASQITTYPESIENMTLKNARGTKLSSYKETTKRQDYDYSYGGIPIFEFSSVGLFPLLYTNGPVPERGTQFLSVEGIDGYDRFEYCGSFGSSEYKQKLRKRENRPVRDTNEYGEDRELPGGLQSPKSGKWWEMFFEAVDKDRKVWEDIKCSMGRGNCRVSIRWQETEIMPDRERPRYEEFMREERRREAREARKAGGNASPTRSAVTSPISGKGGVKSVVPNGIGNAVKSSKPQQTRRSKLNIELTDTIGPRPRSSSYTKENDSIKGGESGRENEDQRAKLRKRRNANDWKA